MNESASDRTNGNGCSVLVSYVLAAGSILLIGFGYFLPVSLDIPPRVDPDTVFVILWSIVLGTLLSVIALVIRRKSVALWVIFSFMLILGINRFMEVIPMFSG